LTFLIKEFLVRTFVVPVIELSIYYEPEKGQYFDHKNLKKSGILIA
jgi:hypothetical protein